MKQLCRLIFLSLFLTATLTSKAGGLPVRSVNRSGNLSLIGAYVGYNSDISYGAIGVSATISGFYFDAMGMGRMHGDDVRVDKWNDKRCFLCHVGYQIPFTKQLRFIPVVGYAYISKGTTDGYDWSVSNSGIYNSYSSDHKISKFDYGGIVSLHIRSAVVNVGVTRAAIYAGIGFELDY